MLFRYFNLYFNFNIKNIVNFEINEILGVKGVLKFLVRLGCFLLDIREVRNSDSGE